jgi:hypothetical protein
MLLHVQYENDTYACVDGPALDRLLLGRTVKRFYRPSHERWIDVYRDPIRGLGGRYPGQASSSMPNQALLCFTGFSSGTYRLFMPECVFELDDPDAPAGPGEEFVADTYESGSIAHGILPDEGF